MENSEEFVIPVFLCSWVENVCRIYVVESEVELTWDEKKKFQKLDGRKSSRNSVVEG